MVFRPYNLFTQHFAAAIRLVLSLTEALSLCAALLCLISLVLSLGFDHNGSISTKFINYSLKTAQITFIINILSGFILDFKEKIRSNRPFKKIIDLLILASAVQWIYPHPTHPWIPWLEQVLYSPTFTGCALAIYSVVSICSWIIRTLDQRTNPSLILSISFLFFIALGSLTLMLPKCTISGISYTDSLFVATSAVCITGLTPVDVSATFTPLGLTVIAIMMQIGALGVMTFTSFFALFFSGNTSVYSQLVIRDMIYTRSINALLPTLLYTLCFTLCIEAIGALALWFSIRDTLDMSTENEIIFSVFHSISAFCNAGFSNLEGGLSNPRLLQGNQLVYVVAIALISTGSIGFPILVNIRDALVQKLSRTWHRLHHRKLRFRVVHSYTMNSKIVVTTWGLLFVAGTILFWILENNHSLAGMTPWEKLVQSMFNSVTPRSAGFSSVNPAGFLNVTLVIVLFLMWIGGASQSTAGGIKVNTLASIWLNMKSTITGSRHTSAFCRTISIGSIRRANAVVAISIFSYISYSIILLWLEPDIPTRSLLFESCSAIFTVGSSLGATPLLGTPAKILLITAMFIGRVGIISLLTGLTRSRKDSAIRYPVDDIIIN